MADATLDKDVAEKVLHLDLKPIDDVALVKIGWKYISSTGPIFILRDGREVVMPPGETLPRPEGTQNFNDRYALYIAKWLGAEIADEVHTYRDAPRPYSTDAKAAMEVVQYMREDGYNFHCQAYAGESAWVVNFVRLPGARDKHNNECRVQYSGSGYGDTFEEAICRAALATVS